MSKWTVILFTVVLLANGCGVLRRHDPVTVEQVKKTLEFEDGNYTLTLAALEDGDFSEVDRESLRARHESEMARLNAWFAAEEAKKVE